MHITINIEGHVAKILESLVERGIVKTKSEAIRLGLLNLGNKYMQHNEKIIPALLSEKALAKDWLSKEDEEAWKDL